MESSDSDIQPQISPSIVLVFYVCGLLKHLPLHNADLYTLTWHVTNKQDYTFYYGAAFILYKSGVFIPTLDRIAIMFGGGIALDSAITWVLYYLVRKSEERSLMQKTVQV